MQNLVKKQGFYLFLERFTMNYLLKNASIIENGSLIKKDICVTDGFISAFPANDATVIDCDKYFVFPGFVDVHVHLREPGFSYKETIKTGTLASARGGYTAVCSMPNLNPVPDSKENLDKQLEIIKKDAVIDVFPYASITIGQKGLALSDMASLSDAIAFSDDGRGVQTPEMMKEAMLKANSLGKMIVAHCEDEQLRGDGYIHDGEYAKLHNHKGISSESEWAPIARDIELVRETGASYHICHVSTKESVEIIRKAKADGLDVTCETAPHYLILTDMDLQEDGKFKMNPPLRSEQDRLALIEGIKDGTIDMIATDHAPHSAEEKSKDLKDSMMGIVGIETAFPLLYTHLVKTNIITLDKLIELLNTNPRKRFNIGSDLNEGSIADLTVFDLNENYIINPDDFLSMGKSTPFEGTSVFGKCKLTIKKGEPVWTETSTKN